MWRGRQLLLSSTLGIYVIGSILMIGSALGRVAQPNMIYISFMLVLLVQAGLMFITVLVPSRDQMQS